MRTHSLVFPLFAALAALLLALPAHAASFEESLGAYKRGQYAKAESAFREVTQAEPSNAEAFYYLGASLAEQNKIDEARAAFDRARQNDLSEDKSKIAEGHLLLRQKKLDEAVAALTAAIEANPENGEAYFYRGLAEASRNNFPAAYENLEKSAALDPFRMHAHYYAGIAANRIRRPDKMAEHFQYVQKLAPESEEARKVESLMKTLR